MRKKKKIVRVIHPSTGPLPDRIKDKYAQHILIFSDASLKTHGGLSAVIFPTPESSPLVFTRSIAGTTSNALELLALAFALEQSENLFPGQKRAFFSDNQDTISRFQTIQSGNRQDFQLTEFSGKYPPNLMKENIEFCWVKGHGKCRGNLIADYHARLAAETRT